jgi:hypothetical protein
MHNAWDSLIDLEKYIESKFYATGSIISHPPVDNFSSLGLIDKVWTSSRYRRACIDIIDARASKKMWMMHCTISPHLDNPAPIFGFDIIAGQGKITGCFLDFSPAGDASHPMIDEFGKMVNKLEWPNVRALPDWALRIFSKHMVAASNIADDTMLEQVVELVKAVVDYYLEVVDQSAGQAENTTEAQNYYCRNQKLNPHNSKVMASLGIPEDSIQRFIDNCLFPEII